MHVPKVQHETWCENQVSRFVSESQFALPSLQLGRIQVRTRVRVPSLPLGKT